MDHNIGIIKEDSLRPLRSWGRGTLIWIAILIAIGTWGAFAYYY